MAKAKYTVRRVKGMGSSLPKALREATFKNYEQARSAVRKYIRTTRSYDSAAESTFNYSNPRINQYGFTIVRG
jgi:hypothetical protein